MIHTLIQNMSICILTYLLYRWSTKFEKNFDKEIFYLNKDVYEITELLSNQIKNQAKLLETLILNNKSIFEDINMTSLKILINSGINLNMKDKTGKNLLHHHSTDMNIIKMLVESGADINIKDNTGRAIFHSNMVSNNEFTDLIIKAGADLNLKDVAGSTVLQFAITSPENFKKLVDAGADVNIKDNTGMTIRQRIQYYYGSNDEITKILNDAHAI